MKRLLLFLCLIIASLNQVVTAEPEALSEQQILSQVLPTTCHFSGYFEQTKHIKGLPTPLKSSGDLFFSCGLGLIWNTSSPIQEVLLGNNSKYYRLDEDENVEVLAGALRYAMSKIFLRLLKGDAEYFSQEFLVEQRSENQIRLIPESDFLKKGINSLVITKKESPSDETSILITIYDVTEQTTEVNINRIEQYDVSNKREAFDKCEVFYPRPSNWCRMMRSPWRFEK